MNTRTPGTTFTQRLVEVVVTLAIALATLTGLGYVAGPHGLGMVQGHPDWPVVGAGQAVMSVVTELDSGVSLPGAPTTPVPAPGSADAGDGADGARPAAVGRPITATVEFGDPSAAQRWAWVIWQAAGPLLAAAGLGLVLAMLRSARRGDPFVTANLRRLQLLTGLVLIGGTLVAWAGEFVRRWLLDSSTVADLVPMDFSFTVLPMLAGVVLAMLAEVWRRGIAMRADLEGLV